VDDLAEIQQLYSRYCWTIDEKLHEEWLDCFTQDGGVEGPNFGRYTGREQLRQFIAKYRSETAMFQMRHVISNIMVEIHDDSAVGKCYLLHYRTHKGVIELSAIGRYHDHLRKVGGKWLFSHREASWDYSAVPARRDS
jgi:3-phenylpropionate/cinnamic acid dioxygenase small subunit